MPDSIRLSNTFARYTSLQNSGQVGCRTYSPNDPISHHRPVSTTRWRYHRPARSIGNADQPSTPCPQVPAADPRILTCRQSRFRRVGVVTTIINPFPSQHIDEFQHCGTLSPLFFFFTFLVFPKTHAGTFLGLWVPSSLRSRSADPTPWRRGRHNPTIWLEITQPHNTSVREPIRGVQRP